jgi:putative addiction module component (TIGR02574 family)
MAVEKVLREALALPPEERERVIAELQRSLETEVDPEALTEEEWQAAWAPEVERRLRDLDEGRTKPISYEDFKSRMRALFPQQ